MRAKYRKQLRKGFSYTDWPSEAPKSALEQERRSAMAQKETEHDGLQRQRTKEAKGWETEGEEPCQTCYSNCERKSTLQRKSTWTKGNETSEERETRLEQMRDRQGAGNSEERDWRLQQTSNILVRLLLFRLLPFRLLQFRLLLFRVLHIFTSICFYLQHCY